jgi:hypothetical protein
MIVNIFEIKIWGEKYFVLGGEHPGLFAELWAKV